MDENTQEPNEPERTNAVQMRLPPDPTEDVTLSVCLGGPTPAQMIQKLMGVELRAIHGLQHIFNNGAKVVPCPFMRLEGFTEEGLDAIFPPENKVLAALRSGRTYKKEKAGEKVERSCVSFIVPAAEGDDIVLELLLGRQLGDKIQKELFA